MEIRSILTVLDGSAQSKKTLEAGIFLGTFFSAHVDVLHVQPLLPDTISYISGHEPVALMAQTQEIQAEEVRQHTEHDQSLFQALCVDAGLKILSPDDHPVESSISFTWHQMIGHENLAIANQGRLSDLIVMSCPEQQAGGIDSSTLETALFDTGRPVIVVGVNFQACAGGRIAIAWDGSRESAHSIGLAIPFLKQASKVLILTVGQSTSVVDPQTLARYLASHGVQAEPIFIEQNEQAIAEILLTKAEDWKAGLLIMGAYGNSPLWESVFGGVTRIVLKRASLPVFMAH